MKTTIAVIEKAYEKQINPDVIGINHTLFWAYKQSLEAGNDLINFYDVIWDKDIEEIANNLKENEVDEFSISSNFSGLINTLAEFEKHGFTMAGIIEIKETYNNWHTNEKAISKAIKMIRK